MHTVRRKANRWLVEFVVAGCEPGDRPQREHIMTFDKGNDAHNMCAWLNGGSEPSFSPHGWKVYHASNKYFSFEEEELEAD